jgi:uncharacterized protein with HEPN domain
MTNFDVDLVIVWNIVTRDLPPIVKKFQEFSAR